MTVRIRFLRAIGVAVSVIDGTLSYDDLIEHRERMASHPHYDPSCKLLFDVRRVTEFAVTGNQIRAFADFAQTGKPRFARMAMVVPDDLGYGLARVFRAYTGRHDDSSLKIFRDAKEAWAWLTAEAPA